MIEFISFDLSFSIKCKYNDNVDKIDKILEHCNSVSHYSTNECMTLIFDLDGHLPEFIKIKNILDNMELS